MRKKENRIFTLQNFSDLKDVLDPLLTILNYLLTNYIILLAKFSNLLIKNNFFPFLICATCPLPFHRQNQVIFLSAFDAVLLKNQFMFPPG